MAALVPHSRRWVDVTLDLGGEDLTYLYGLPDDAFPLLEKFALLALCGDVFDRLSQALSAAPRLYAVALEHTAIDTWVMPWSNLTSLCLSMNDSGPSRTEELVSMRFLIDTLKSIERGFVGYQRIR